MRFTHAFSPPFPPGPHCRLVCSFLQNLLASKIMKPAIDYVTKPVSCAILCTCTYIRMYVCVCVCV